MSFAFLKRLSKFRLFSCFTGCYMAST